MPPKRTSDEFLKFIQQTSQGQVSLSVMLLMKTSAARIDTAYAPGNLSPSCSHFMIIRERFIGATRRDPGTGSATAARNDVSSPAEMKFSVPFPRSQLMLEMYFMEVYKPRLIQDFDPVHTGGG